MLDSGWNLAVVFPNYPHTVVCKWMVSPSKIGNALMQIVTSLWTGEMTYDT